MTNFTAQWDMGYLIGLYACIGVAVICVIAIIGGLIAANNTRPGYYGGDTGAGVAVIAAVVLLIVTGVGLFIATPFSGQYHRFVPKTGTVADIGSRLIASGSGSSATVNQKFVVTYTDGSTYGCLDTRCANVTKGDHLTLLCERVFQFNQPNEGWDCNWGEDVKANGSVIP
jgi:hypothetical protein